eukprot:TRINITY_DN6651_c0_g2_i1.p1 TRINITY_DN6651_c0_g2~~TRINITY_DN6651_c0_g2_i1.p1  ORF type:complete len:283 (-),score=45.28 TRINITY_DN6651_c0_g2_i1:401-1249(-)
MKSGDALQQLSATQNLCLGMAAGMASKTANYPLLTWKIARQQSLPLQLNLSVYRGLPMAMLNLGSTIGVQFWCTGYFQTVLSSGKRVSPSQQMAASFLGGVCSGVSCSVWELTMIQQQRFGGSIASVSLRVMREFGAHTILRGMICTMGRESLVSMAMLGMTPVMQQMLVDEFDISSDMGLAVSALFGSLFSATVSQPLDTIKTCMQGDCEQKKYSNIRGTRQSLVDEFGMRAGLFKGLAWRISFVGTTFFLVHKFKQTFAPQFLWHDATKDEAYRAESICI